MIDYKSLVVHVETTPLSDQRLSCAVSLAERFGARLTGVGGKLPLYLSDPWCGSMDGDLMQVVRDDDSAALAQSKVRFFSEAQVLGDEKARWRDTRDSPARSLIAYAAGADLLVASLRTPDTALSPSAADLVLKSGIPVLALPEGLSDLSPKAIVIAWKDAPQTRRAISDALPLLVQAQCVTVLEVVETGSDDGSVVADVVERLSLHGVKCTVQTIAHGRSPVSAALLDVVDSGLVDLVVSGAFGHSRAKEWIFGGVTKALLEEATCPVFFSH